MLQIADYDDTALGTGTLTVPGEQVLTVENYYNGDNQNV